PTSRIKFSDDGAMLLIYHVNNGIRVYHTKGAVSQLIKPLVIFDADFVNQEQLVVSAVIPSPHAQKPQLGIVIYDIGSGEIVAEDYPGDVRGVCVDKQNRRIFAGLLDGYSFIIYDWKLNRLSTTQIPELYMPLDLSVSQSGERLAIGGIFVGIWDVSSDPKFIKGQFPSEGDCTGTPCEVNAMAMTPDGSYVAASIHGAKGSCFVLDGKTGELIRWFGPEWDFMTSPDPGPVSISHDGRYIAVCEPPHIKLYNTADGTVFQKLKVKSREPFTFLPVGNTIAIGNGASIDFWKYS
ncbi:MAG: hypothetical protein AAFR81_29330, partial [Chloroflexota bacterium]